MTLIARLGLLALLTLMSGCGTPTPVRSLATSTAAQTTQVSAQLKGLGKQNRQLAEMRAATVANLRTANREVAARHRLDVALLASTENETNERRVALLKWMDETQEIFASERVDTEQIRSDVLSTQSTAADRTSELGRVAKALATLGKEDDTSTRAKFLIDYFSGVYEGVKEAQEAAKVAADEAEKTSETVNSDADEAAEKAGKEAEANSDAVTKTDS